MFPLIYLFIACYFIDSISCNSSPNDAGKNKSSNQTWNYCNHPDCSIRNQHTMCLAVDKHSPRLFASGMTSWMRFQILLLHNRHRDNIALGLEPGQPPATNMRKMYWDYELEKIAEVWARQCQKRHDECRNTIRFNVLQNMDVRPVVPRVTEAQLLSDAVGSWFSGSRALPPEHVWSFKLSNCSAVGGCNAHWYSAAAWGSTWRLGCSQALCTAKRSTCSVFRKKRRIQSMANLTNVTMSTVTENLLLRHSKVTPIPPDFRDFPIRNNNDNNKESPLHRGVSDTSNKDKKSDDINIIAYTFCNYGPAGNIDGFPMYEAGTACSNCPQGTHCADKTHRALCASQFDPETDAMMSQKSA